MGLIERSIELIRSEVSNNKQLEMTNYKIVYPITVIDAVKEDMSDNARNLRTMLDEIYSSLSYKQKIFPSKSSNYIVTYGGSEGAIGSIPMSHNIGIEPDTWSDNRIPTELAVGQLLERYGVFDGSLSEKFLWGNIVNRPTTYSELGDDDFGYISQAGITNIINQMTNEINNNFTSVNNAVNHTSDALLNHINNSNNPHNLIPSSIGAASQIDFISHIENYNNPHNVTKNQIGLGNIDNTSDLNKPISIATQIELDKINNILRNLGIDIDRFRYLVDIRYDVNTGKLIFTFNDDSEESTIIGTNELIDEVRFDKDNHIITFYEVSGRQINIDLSSLYVEGYSSDTVDVKIGNNGEIISNIKNKAINSEHIANKGIEAINLGDQSVTERSIKDYSVTSQKLAEGSVTSSKIFSESIQEGHISSRAVTGNKLFSSLHDKSFLFVNSRGTDPIWSPMSSDMLPDDLILTRHIFDQSITSDKLAEDLNLIGVPSVNGEPIATHDYIQQMINNSRLNNINLIDRSVDGRVLFTSSIKNRILGVYETNQDPSWGKVNHEMLDDNIIKTNNIIDKSITESKFADDSVSARSIDNNAILSRHISESSVISEKIFKANETNMVLASDSTLHPVYSKVLESMIGLEAVNTQNIKNQSITPEKLQHSTESYSILATENLNTDAKWTKIVTQMIADSAITKSKLFTSDNDNVVLGARYIGDHPEYMKINSEMLEDEFLQDRHIPTGSIKRYHLDPDIFAVPETEIVPDAELIQMKRTWWHDGTRSAVLSIGANSDSKPSWNKIDTDFIKNNAVTLEKIQKSNNSNRIIAVIDKNESPKYVLLQNDMIQDETIDSSKLASDLLLRGNPHIGEQPDINSNDGSIASTKWVNDRINEITGIDRIAIDIDRLENHSIDLSKLKVTSDKPKVLGIVNDNVEFLNIKEDMIDNSAVTTNKLQRDIKLLGTPTLDVRPSPQSSDINNNGNEIPDTQWVNNKVEENNAEFYQKLQEKICCLQTPDPEKLDANHVKVKSITSEDIEKIINDELEVFPVGSKFINYGNKLGPIPYDQIKGLILGQISPITSKYYADENITIVSMSEDTINKLLNGELNPQENPDSYEIYNGYRDHECQCFEGKDYQFILSIKEEDLIELLNGVSTPIVDNYITYEDKVFGFITRQQIYDVINDIIDNPESTEEVLINNQLIRPISEERLRDILLNGLESEFTRAADITVYESHEKIFEGVPLKDNAVITSYIQNRAITGSKLFTSNFSNMVLAVIEANTDPVYTKVTHDMVEDWIIQTKYIESSNNDDMILGVRIANSDPVWMKINHSMLEDYCIDENNLIDECVTNNKIKDRTIRENKLANEEMIKTTQLYDQSVTNRKIANRSITGEKIDRNQVVPGYTTVEENTEYERRSIRNTIISASTPMNSKAGDIWFQI